MCGAAIFPQFYRLLSHKRSRRFWPVRTRLLDTVPNGGFSSVGREQIWRPPPLVSVPK